MAKIVTGNDVRTDRAEISPHMISCPPTIPEMITGNVTAFDLVRTRANGNSFQENMKQNRPVTISAGTASGSATLQNA